MYRHRHPKNSHSLGIGVWIPVKKRVANVDIPHNAIKEEGKNRSLPKDRIGVANS
jgi:hypothetical protein